MRFLGNIEAKIDAKGRVFLPSAFRKTLQQGGEERLVMRKDVFNKCLVLYPESVWNQQLDALRAKLNRWKRQDQQLLRQFVADAEAITLDGNGRFLIGRRYLDLAEIEQGVRFIGVDDTIEIWSTQQVEEAFMDADEFGAAFEQIMGLEF